MTTKHEPKTHNYAISIPFRFLDDGSPPWQVADKLRQIIASLVMDLTPEKLNGLRITSVYPPEYRDMSNKAIMDYGLELCRQGYWSDVYAVAEEFDEQAKAGEFADEDAAETWLHETIDGHGRVIHAHKAQECLRWSGHDGAYLEDFGADGVVKDGVMNWGILAYAAMLADVREVLRDEHHIEVGDKATWPKEEDEAEEANEPA